MHNARRAGGTSRTRHARRALSAVTLAGLTAGPAAATNGATVERVSVSSGETQGGLGSSQPTVSADGRFIAFRSSSSTLVDGDTNGAPDVFVRDRIAGITERVSVSSSETQAIGASGEPSISADGRFVAFSSSSPDLVDCDENEVDDVFVRDRAGGVTERVSVDSGGVEANSSSSAPSISPDGRHVAFASIASRLVAGDTNGLQDVFVRDRATATTDLVSASNLGAQPS